MPPARSDWSDSNLRRRSFRGQNLSGVNFRGSDLRGCDFQDADLSGANLSHARIGIAWEAKLWGGLICVGTGAFALHMLSQLMFGVLGITTTDPNYGLRQALTALLAVVGLLISLISWGILKQKLLWVVSFLEGALIGFWGGGLISSLDLMSAITGSIVSGILLMLGVCFFYAQGAGIMVATLGIAMANGMFFLAGVNTLQLLLTMHLQAAGVWFGVAVLYGWFIMRAIGWLFLELQQIGMTSFARANLSRVQWK